MSKPASPAEIKARRAKCEHIPPFVFEAVNKLLALNIEDDYASLNQEDLITEILKLSPETPCEELFEKKWFDFEPFYNKKGWKVKYIKGAYYETFDPYWVFEVKK
jgi:hypothetical protein